MNWLESLLWDPSSVAHIVCLYAFVISVGVLLGKIKIFGVSLGVTFVLFAGILMGHFGFTGETHILHFIREFGLILFVFTGSILYFCKVDIAKSTTKPLLPPFY